MNYGEVNPRPKPSSNKLIIDIDDLNATNVDNDTSVFLEFINALKINHN